jgi:hypothetical protein
VSAAGTKIVAPYKRYSRAILSDYRLIGDELWGRRSTSPS